MELPPILASITTVDYKNLQNGRLEDRTTGGRDFDGIYPHFQRIVTARKDDFRGIISRSQCTDGILYVAVVKFNKPSVSHLVNEKYKILFTVGVNEMRSMHPKHSVLLATWQSHQ